MAQFVLMRVREHPKAVYKGACRQLLDKFQSGRLNQWFGSAWERKPGDLRKVGPLGNVMADQPLFCSAFE